MRRVLLLLLLLPFLAGCASGLGQPFGKDPITGGEDASHIMLLSIPCPIGLQRYSSHSSAAVTSDQGLETLRGYVDQQACASTLDGNLRRVGWQLVMQQRFGQRAIYIYQKKNQFTALVFRVQGALTILEVWLGNRLAANNTLNSDTDPASEPIKSVAPEHYGPASQVETFGPSERSL